MCHTVGLKCHPAHMHRSLCFHRFKLVIQLAVAAQVTIAMAVAAQVTFSSHKLRPTGYKQADGRCAAGSGKARVSCTQSAAAACPRPSAAGALHNF